MRRLSWVCLLGFLLLLSVRGHADLGPGRPATRPLQYEVVFVIPDRLSTLQFVLYPRSPGSPFATLVASGAPVVFEGLGDPGAPPVLYAVKEALPKLDHEAIGAWLAKHAVARSEVAFPGPKPARVGPTEVRLVEEWYDVEDIRDGKVKTAYERTIKHGLGRIMLGDAADRPAGEKAKPLAVPAPPPKPVADDAPMPPPATSAAPSAFPAASVPDASVAEARPTASAAPSAGATPAAPPKKGCSLGGSGASDAAAFSLLLGLATAARRLRAFRSGPARRIPAR